MAILTRLQAVQITRQAQQHYDHDDRSHRYDDAKVFAYAARLMFKEGFFAAGDADGIICRNSNGTITTVKRRGQRFYSEVRTK